MAGHNAAMQPVSPLSWDKVKDFCSTVRRNVTLSQLPEVFLKLRKRTDIYAVELLVGTDVQLCTAANSLAEARAAPWPVYKPNLHVEAYDRIFHGRVGLSTRDSQLSYTKKYDVFNLALGVSALFDYRTLTPYAGFTLESTAGVSSAALSNTFSFNHAVNLPEVGGLQTNVATQASVRLPGTRYDARTGKMGLSSPVDVQLHRCIATLTV